MANYTINLVSNTNSLSGNCGIPDSALNGVSGRYIVTIIATLGKSGLGRNLNTGSVLSAITGPGGDNEFTVYAFLQDKITLNASSKWEGVTQGMPGNANVDKWAGIAEFAAQSTLGRTTITPLTTRRKWAGSDPISLHMKLKFESFSDPYKEVILPCIGLQGLTLPRGGIANTFGLIPPGPSPFDLNLKGEPQSERTENITLSIGGFLTFNSVIIKDVNISFENRMSEKGPIGAEVDLTIETYQMLTREDLMKVTGLSSSMFSGNLGQGRPTATPITAP